MAVKTVIGHPARGNDFFIRLELTDKLWEKIESGSNILLTAPRRVGKSSLMFYLMDNPRENFQIIYLDTESVNNENEFYRKIFNHIVSSLQGIRRYSKAVLNFTKNLASMIESIGPEGIELGESRLNYYNELIKLIKSIQFNGDKLIIMVDEYAETVQNIIKDENETKAIHFLQSNRALRQMPEISENLQFIFAGSIGLENIVDRISASSTINDLYSLHIPPFSEPESKKLITKITSGSGYILKEPQICYMLNEIEWLIPFYIQLIIDEIDKLDIEGEQKVVTKKMIDSAIKKAIEHRNYFGNWHTRLRKSYKGEEYTFTKELLNYISENDTITSGEIFDLAVKFKVENAYKNIVNALKYDGYINNSDDVKIYRFNSPILKKWWYQNVAN